MACVRIKPQSNKIAIYLRPEAESRCWVVGRGNEPPHHQIGVYIVHFFVDILFDV